MKHNAKLNSRRCLAVNFKRLVRRGRMNMSLSCECDIDGPSVFNEKTVKARKDHKCCECGATIHKGEEYEYTFGVWEGDAQSFHTCETCSDLRASMRALGFCTAYGELKSEHAEYKAEYA